MFAREAERRLKKADGLFAPEASIERVMNGVKKRLSLAANALSTSLLVRGLTSEPAVQNWLASLTVSEAFKQQVLRELEEGRFKNIGEAARGYGIRGGGTIQKWIRGYGQVALDTPGHTSLQPPEDRLRQAPK